MKKTYRVGVVRRQYRSGMGRLFERVTVGAGDSSQDAADAIDKMLMSGDPQRRLNVIKNRAARHRGVVGLSGEIDWVEARLTGSNWLAELADLNALLALERGLDLLDVGTYLHELEGLRRADAGRAKGLQASAEGRAKLPDAATLEKMIDNLTRSEGGNRRRAVGIVRQRTGASTQAIGQKLKRRSETT